MIPCALMIFYLQFLTLVLRSIKYADEPWYNPYAYSAFQIHLWLLWVPYMLIFYKPMTQFGHIINP